MTNSLLQQPTAAPSLVSNRLSKIYKLTEDGDDELGRVARGNAERLSEDVIDYISRYYEVTGKQISGNLAETLASHVSIAFARTEGWKS